MSKLYKKCPTIVKLIETEVPKIGLDYTITKVLEKKLKEHRPDVDVLRFDEDFKTYIVSKNILETVKTIDINVAKDHMTSEHLTGTKFCFVLGNDNDGLLSVEIIELDVKDTVVSILAVFNYQSGSGLNTALEDVLVGYADLVNTEIITMSKGKASTDVEAEKIGTLVMQLIIYLYYGDIVTKHYAPNENIQYSSTELVKNTLKTPVIYLNTLWKQRVSVGGFKVKGHWRMQAFGKRHKERQLKWIEGFNKKGYNRKATKEIVDEL